MNSTENKKKTVLITGTSGEIGSYLAAQFLRAGWSVFGLDKNERVVDASSGLRFSKCDLACPEEAGPLIDALATEHGGLDAVVNCAGIIANSPLVSLTQSGWTVHDFALWDEVISSVLKTAFVTTAFAVRHMLQARRKGVIVNISSVCARGNPGQAAYSAAKAGLNGLTMALAKELAPMGIRVVGLAPGYFDTASTRGNVPQPKLARIAGAVPSKRLGSLEEIYDAVDFIIRNQYVNGTILELDGGLVL
jgi:3-oxoacyl-[acyl-carrier protein] reductase